MWNDAKIGNESGNKITFGQKILKILTSKKAANQDYRDGRNE